MAAEEYTIGQLAELIDVPTSTLRYYERRGLLDPLNRTSGNYRIYGAESVERLYFIRAAQATGFTLDDVLTALSFREGSRAPCSEVQHVIEERLQDVDKKIADLRRVNRVLKASLNTAAQGRSPRTLELATDSHG